MTITLLAGTFFLMCCFGIGSLFLRRQVVRELRIYYPSVVERLNLDTGVFKRGIDQSYGMALFVLRRSRWVEIEEPGLRRKLHQLRLIEICYYGLFMFTFVGVSLLFISGFRV